MGPAKKKKKNSLIHSNQDTKNIKRKKKHTPTHRNTIERKRVESLFLFIEC